ncbi:hypothetical protein BRADI_2g26250v3 [Brachypodium distachyon]|uniref:Uncharacterized protein n=1 Tax=Brachypodium distachyon TaxID=15368 RepID=I1HJQ8_BRADI|nr:hypothetical protein BRADI_2g26250v3 [Brachypodium distachyon]
MVLMACGHCGPLRRIRMEGEFFSCDSCGKVLDQRRRHAVLQAQQRRRRRWRLGLRKKRDERAVAGGGGGGMVGGRSGSGAPDAESDTGVCFTVELP